jgi:hypothetical protein
MNSDSDLTSGSSTRNDAVDSSGLSGDLRNEDPGVRENPRYQDARAGSVKRVAAAVGEGAAVVVQIHRFLSAER